MRKQRQYSLFEWTKGPGNRKNWHSLSDMSFPLEQARVVFQDVLLNRPNCELRPVEKHQTVKIRYADERILG